MPPSPAILPTPRLTLRPLGKDDVSAMHALLADPHVRKYLWDDVVISRERAADVVAASAADFAKHRYGLWGAYDTASGDLAGFCGLRESVEGLPELLYGFWPRYSGRGLATEAARAVLSYAFTTLRLPEVVAATDVPNDASLRVLERLGMQLERRGLLNGLDTFFFRLSSNRGTP